MKHDTVNTFRAALVADFGSVSEYNEIRADNLFSGKNGLNGLLNLMENVVDSFPTSDHRYTEYMRLFSGLGEILATQIFDSAKVSFISDIDSYLYNFFSLRGPVESVSTTLRQTMLTLRLKPLESQEQ